MIPVKSYAAQKATTPLAPFRIERREVGPQDVLIDILYCGVCHTDINQTRDAWGGSIFPMVPGHEIVGRITKVGKDVTKFKVGDIAGVGYFVDSCRVCPSCKEGLEQYCDNGMVATDNGYEKDKVTRSYGGYSSQIVVDESYVLRISSKLSLDRVGPLLCAGITTYSSIMHWKVGKGHRLGVLGLGGLGHMAVKWAASLGSEVTVLSASRRKEKDAQRLGAHHFALTSDESVLKNLRGHFDFIIDTVPALHDLNQILGLLKRDGTLINLGAPLGPALVNGFSLIGGRKKIGGSTIGGIKETQEMLDYCATHSIMSDVEVIPIQEINNAYERVMKADVKYRFVIDMATL